MSGKVELTYKASNGINITYMEDPYPVQNFYGKRKPARSIDYSCIQA